MHAGIHQVGCSTKVISKQMKQAIQQTLQIGLQHSAVTLTITKVVKLLLFRQPISDAHVTTTLLLRYQAATSSTALVGFCMQLGNLGIPVQCCVSQVN